MAQVQSLDRSEAEQERLKKILASKPKAYEDKVMDPASLPPVPAGDALPDADQGGFTSFVSETRAGVARSDSGLLLRSASELGQRFEVRRETVNYGDFVAQIDLRTSSGMEGLSVGALGFSSEKSSGRFTLRNIGFPIDAKTYADTAVGDIFSEVTDALARAYRVSLGSSTVRGIGTRVFDGSFDLRAGVGARGSLVGGPYPGFESNQGSLAWAGYSKRLPGDGFAGVQVNRAAGLAAPTLFARAAGQASEDVTSVAGSVGYGGDLSANGSTKARLMYVSSQGTANISDLPRRANGVFLEAGLRLNSFRHEFGAFSADPNLRFGDYPMASDNRGAYWRVDTSSSRTAWGMGLDLEDQNPRLDLTRLASRRVGVSANAQYRISRDSSIGGSLTLGVLRYRNGDRLFGDGSRSLNASTYYQTRFGAWGRSRFSATVHRNEVLVANDVPATGEEFAWEQDWITGKYETMRPEFITTLGFARDRSNGATELRPTAGATFRLWPDADWSIGGSLHYTASDTNLSTSRGLAGTVDTEKTLADGWRMGASIILNQARVSVGPVIPGVPQVFRTNDKSGSVYLRWEGNRGSTLQAAGLRNAGSAGGGGIEGTVYFDANRDGEQQPGENGVPNVEVFLDGRYRVTTDRNGRFDFPLVATGRHQLTLTLETVPLPWGMGPNANVTVEVPLRGQITARIPVVRVGD